MSRRAGQHVQRARVHDGGLSRSADGAAVLRLSETADAGRDRACEELGRGARSGEDDAVSPGASVVADRRETRRREHRAGAPLPAEEGRAGREEARRHST